MASVSETADGNVLDSEERFSRSKEDLDGLKCFREADPGVSTMFLFPSSCLLFSLSGLQF